MTDTLTGLRSRVATLANCAPEDLDIDVPFHVLGLTSADIQDVVARHAAKTGKTVPTKAKRDSVERGLTDLAGFSDQAATALAAYAPACHQHSLRSLAAALDKGRYSPQSTKFTPTGRVLRRFGGLFALAIALPAVLATRPQEPVCTQCALTPSEQFISYATFSIPAAAILTAAAFAPALWHLYRLGSPQIKVDKHLSPTR